MGQLRGKDFKGFMGERSSRGESSRMPRFSAVFPPMKRGSKVDDMMNNFQASFSEKYHVR